ncbi:MAG: short-chain dehydrogenase/reductase [Deltaproteobacteria bacterium]|nr:short-chain dehydrogenase/reductase [Deltaproteobacteria bacterium]
MREVPEFHGKVAVVTGAGSGIGRAGALAFACAGAKVVVADTNARSGAETVHLIADAGGAAVFVRVDVARAADVEAMVGTAVRTWGRLDFAYNNAGIAEPRIPLTDLTEEVWDQTIDINLKGVWLCMKYEIPQMLRHGRGAIVNMSSAVGLVAARQQAAYVASKHGVVGLTKAAALEYAHAGIRVNAICPGAIRTPALDRFITDNPQIEARLVGRYPIGRLGTPEEVAAAAVWLCSDAAAFITGHTLVMDGGALAQ